MRRTTLLVFGILLVVGSATTFTDDGGSRRVSVRMSGYNETPLALSTPGNGRFQARISRDESEIQWELSFGDLEGTVTQSHIHFGSSAQTGGVSIFLCSNLGNGPVGTQACPASAPDRQPRDRCRDGRQRDRARGPGHRGRRIRGNYCGDPCRHGLRQRSFDEVPGRRNQGTVPRRPRQPGSRPPPLTWRGRKDIARWSRPGP